MLANRSSKPGAYPACEAFYTIGNQGPKSYTDLSVHGTEMACQCKDVSMLLQLAAPAGRCSN
jgi:hypothetical protein